MTVEFSYKTSIQNKPDYLLYYAYKTKIILSNLTSFFFFFVLFLGLQYIPTPPILLLVHITDLDKSAKRFV
jgi:hypothetical protein